MSESDRAPLAGHITMTAYTYTSAMMTSRTQNVSKAFAMQMSMSPPPSIVPQEVFPSRDESGRKLRSDQPVAGHLGEGV